MPITTNSQLAIQTIRSKMEGKETVVFVSGTFSILHPGHLRLLRFAAECGSFLVVGVLSNQFAKMAYLEESERQEAVSAMTWVDHAFVLEDAPTDFIAELQPEVVVMGNEHANANNAEQSVVGAYGGQLLFGSGGTTFSSLDIS